MPIWIRLGSPEEEGDAFMFLGQVIQGLYSLLITCIRESIIILKMVTGSWG